MDTSNDDLTRGKFAELAAGWRSTAAELRRYGGEGQAAALETCAGELEDAAREAALEAVTLEDASELGGYSYSHLQDLVARGEIENIGKKHAPRLRRCDVPRKPGHGTRGSRTEILDRTLKACR